MLRSACTRTTGLGRCLLGDVIFHIAVNVGYSPSSNRGHPVEMKVWVELPRSLSDRTVRQVAHDSEYALPLCTGGQQHTVNGDVRIGDAYSNSAWRPVHWTTLLSLRKERAQIICRLSNIANLITSKFSISWVQLCYPDQISSAVER